MLSYVGGTMRFPGRSGKDLRLPRGTRFGDAASTVATAGQVMDALRRAVCEKKNAGRAMVATEIIALGAQLVSNARANGMDYLSAGMLTAQIATMGYAMARGEVDCPSAPSPSNGGAATTPPPAAEKGGIGAGTALAIGAGLVGVALIAKK